MSAHTRLSRAQARLRRAARAYAAADTNPARERTFHDLSHAAITYAAAKADVERERSARKANPAAGEQVWGAPDGTMWIYHAPFAQWTGWQPGEAGVWQVTIEEFRRSYPDAPDWDGGPPAGGG